MDHVPAARRASAVRQLGLPTEILDVAVGSTGLDQVLRHAPLHCPWPDLTWREYALQPYYPLTVGSANVSPSSGARCGERTRTHRCACAHTCACAHPARVAHTHARACTHTATHSHIHKPAREQGMEAGIP